MVYHGLPSIIGDKVDGQHWTTVRELWIRKDKEQCESWKDEVQNILIFSALFSAIVTAFLIESQAHLQPNPAQETIQLLRQIAAQSAGKSWVSEVELKIDPVSIWVNVFWFLSLVLNLTTALIGIVSLQWIRSHMQSLGKGADSLGLSYMHSQSLHQSNIPRIFTALPVILIFGLTFFFIGLIMFLFNLSWPVAIPVTLAVMCTFAFLLITTLHPALQSLPPVEPSENKNCFPSPYRSPQSSLFLPQTDRGSRSEIWLQHRTKDLKRPLSHLEFILKDIQPKTFAYDTIKALLSVQESRSAESEKERTALLKCLAEVLPIHLDLFPTGDLADLVPFLPPSEYVPSALFLHQDSVPREDLSAVALLQVATCRGQPSQTIDLVAACFRTTRWLFERSHTLDPVPNKQPLHLISKPGTPRYYLQHCNHSLDLDKVSLDALEGLIDSLTRFFNFATDFQPESQILNKTTHTSSYTYWFLHLSAKILTKCQLSEELQARHTYILHMITVHLNRQNTNEYLFYTASIYASNISTSLAMRSSPFWGGFICAVNGRRRDFGLQRDHPSQLCKALKADEVVWGNIDRSLEALEASDIVFVSNSHWVNDTMAAHLPLAPTHDQNPTLGEGGKSSGQTGDASESPHRG